jgi:hypothetical protein
MQFQTETAPDGSQILKREFTSITGRKHVMISDRYSTIKEEYEKDPATGADKLVRREVKFKHSFVKKHLLNEKGQVNTDAVQALFNSSIGQNPAYRQAIMEQLGADILKTKGKEVGNYFVSRNVTYDAADPYKISVEQIDHSGKTTKYTLDFNMTTGQTAVSYAQSYGKNKQDVDVFFSNGVVDIQTTAERDAYGRVTSEVTKFRYSADAKKGHDSMFIDDDSNQIVDDSGTIASNLGATTSSGAQNPYNLLYGMDNIAGVTSVGRVSTSAYMLDNVLRRGRLNRSNKIRTNLSGSFI